MNAALLAQLIIALGPVALSLIPKLIEVWSKPSLTPEEVKSLCEITKKDYDAYIAEARRSPTTA